MIKEDIQQLLQPVVAELGYQLWGCEYIAQGKYSLLRIYIDHEKGIGIADCERVSKQVEAVLDVEDPITSNYSLEVSSPGIPRPLFYKEHYQKYLHCQVLLKLGKPIDGSRKIKGTIFAVDEHSITIKMEEKNYEIQFSNIIKANLGE